MLRLASETRVLSGWGRMSPAECEVFRPDRADVLPSLLESDGSTTIARGLGRSYGDVSVNAGNRVVDVTRLDYIHSFDPDTGVVDCEAGVSLETLIQAFLPRGFFLPVTPGTKFVTVGGAIANDVHGKNHHAVGSFGHFVESLTLLTPRGDTMTCSPVEHPEIFWATVGGIGLTGFILSARIRLQRVETGYIKVDYLRCGNLDAVLEAAHEGDDAYQYSVAWCDCLASGRSLGRSVLMRGNHARLTELPSALAGDPFPREKPRLAVSFDFPGFVLNSLSVRAFNDLFYLRHHSRDDVFVDWDSYFYPLDRLRNWNRMYGKRGFVQYQATFPPESEDGIVKMLQRLSETRRASFLAVIKRMGTPNPALLSHPIEGYTLNLDLPNKPGLVDFLHELDRLLLDHGGRLYFAKDICAKAETIAEMYPKLDEFRDVCAPLDPDHRLASNLARRLGIVPLPNDR